MLASPAWAHVTTAGRRAGPPPPPQHAHKLTQTVVDMDALPGQGAAAFAGADVAFCTLGTKRRIAGSAEAYIKARRLTIAWAGLPGIIAVHTSRSPRSLLASALAIQSMVTAALLPQWDAKAS